MTKLASAVLTSAMMRRVQAEGGTAMVLAKGDATSGAILVLCSEKGVNSALCERILNISGDYEWQRVGPQDIENIEEVTLYIQRRQARDPDLWVIELDIPNAQRLIAEMTAEG